MSQEPQLTRSVDDPDAPSSSGTRVMNALAVPGRMLMALLLPDRGMPSAVFRERGGAALLVVILCAGLSAFVLGSRIDTTSTVLQGETMRMQMQGPGAEARSDRELQEEIDKSRSMAQVTMGLVAGGWVPLQVLLMTLGWYLVGRFVGGRPTMVRTFAAVTHASLPFAVKSLAVAAMASTRTVMTPGDIEKLASFSNVTLLAGPLARFATVDLFTVWSMVLVGFGLAAAASISRRKAFMTVTIVYVLTLLIAGAMAGGPQGGGRGPMPPRGN